MTHAIVDRILIVIFAIAVLLIFGLMSGNGRYRPTRYNNEILDTRTGLLIETATIKSALYKEHDRHVR
jgi:hypothetical protein